MYTMFLINDLAEKFVGGSCRHNKRVSMLYNAKRFVFEFGFKPIGAVPDINLYGGYSRAVLTILSLMKKREPNKFASPKFLDNRVLSPLINLLYNALFCIIFY